VALCQARISTKPLWGFSSSNPYHSQSRAEQLLFLFPPWTNAMYTLCLQVDVKICLKYTYQFSLNLQQFIKCGCADFEIPTS
jgi:hypothetical protein